MGLPKGRTNNPYGRKKLVPNKIGRGLKEKIREFVDSKFDELPGIWRQLSPRDKSMFLKELLPYLEAKLQAVQLSGEVEFKSLPENQIDEIVEKLINHGKAKK
jgi:hypothetical protein